MCVENMKNGQKIIQPLNNKKDTLISVVVMTYKNQQKLYDTLDSILIQNYPNIEIIISDDASGEQNKFNIIQHIEKKKLNNIEKYKILCNTNNLGTVVHANKVVKECAGEYIKFISCGDSFFNENSLSELYNFISSGNFEIATSKSLVSNENFRVNFYEYPNSQKAVLINDSDSKNLNYILMKSNIISAVATIFQKKFIEEYLFDEEYRYLEDWPLWLRMTREGFKIPCMNKITMYYSLGGISSKHINAYKSELLKSDMILCYEKEILPYIKKERKLCNYIIMNKYQKLKLYEEMKLVAKIKFIFKYFPVEGYLKIKFIVKKIVILIGGKK